MIDVGANGAVRATSTYYSTILPGTKAEVIGDKLKITLQLRLINFPAGKKYIYARTVNVQEVDSGWKQVGEFDVTVGTSQIKGDCDGDGELTVKDALAAIQMSVGNLAVDMCCDYNGDGKVDSSDAREILKAIEADQ